MFRKALGILAASLLLLAPSVAGLAIVFDHRAPITTNPGLAHAEIQSNSVECTDAGECTVSARATHDVEAPLLGPPVLVAGELAIAGPGVPDAPLKAVCSSDSKCETSLTLQADVPAAPTQVCWEITAATQSAPTPLVGFDSELVCR